MRIATIVALMALVMLPITAAQAQYYQRAEASGVPLKLVFAYSTNPDCSPYGRTTIRLVEAPQHGVVRIARAMDFPSFPQNNIRNVCNRRRVAGTSAHYVSRRGYVGTDQAVIEIIFPTGRLERRSYTIYVR